VALRGKSLVPLARGQYRCVMSTVNTLGLPHYLSDGGLVYLIGFGTTTRHLHLKKSIYCRSKVDQCCLSGDRIRPVCDIARDICVKLELKIGFEALDLIFVDWVAPDCLERQS
jgi:hypothetical protein